MPRALKDEAQIYRRSLNSPPSYSVRGTLHRTRRKPRISPLFSFFCEAEYWAAACILPTPPPKVCQISVLANRRFQAWAS